MAVISLKKILPVTKIKEKTKGNTTLNVRMQ